MKIRCECGAIYNVPETTCGKNVECKRCSTTFVCPTPPPKPDFGLADRNVPGTFVRSRNAKGKSEQRTDAQEGAILKKFMSEEKSLEDRMRERRENSIEEDRTANAVRYMIVGACWLVGAVVLGFVLFATSSAFATGRGRIRVIALLLVGLGGQYWLPPIVGLFGVYKITIGVLTLFRVVDIQSNKQLPTNW